MRITKSIGLALLVLTSACASTPGGRGSRQAAKAPLAGGVAEFKVISYDGAEFNGRVLIGATVDTLVIDGRLHDWWDVELYKIRECGKTELLKVSSVEPLFFGKPRPDQIITLRPGYWYGGKVSFLLMFDKSKGRIGPECFEAELVVRDIDLRVAATLPIQVVQTDKPPAPPDGGAPAEPKPPASDGRAL